ncbi:MAG: phosphoglucosamine mutase, partial [Rhodospirillaceae bacterium]|nr:phosphoglucosamine mutase [Rhodospirillaceae bacterium]
NNVRYQSGDGAAPLDAGPVKQAIADGHSRLGDGGRLVIRRSGTEPVIRVMAEGDDESLVAAVVESVCASIEAAAR